MAKPAGAATPHDPGGGQPGVGGGRIAARGKRKATANAQGQPVARSDRATIGSEVFSDMSTSSTARWQIRRWSSSRHWSAAAQMRSSNQTVRPRALKNLGYRPSRPSGSSSTSPTRQTCSALPACGLEHYEVFDCAMGERAISPMGHVRDDLWRPSSRMSGSSPH